MSDNLILRTDSYKLGHWVQYPPNTTEIFSYIESRGGGEYTLFFGLQYYLKKYLTKPVTQTDVAYAAIRAAKHGLSFNKEGWEYIVQVHGGYLPLEIRAVPEGTLVSTKNVLVTVRNTDPKCFWLTNYEETLVLKVWYPTTVATTSYKIRKTIKGYLSDTSDNIDGLDFKLHDFGYRGASSEETAAIGSAANLLCFKGTDTFAGLEMLTEYYGADMAGFSIHASEHSTIISWLKECERQAYENMLVQYGDRGIFACVSDSYNIFEAIKMWGSMKEQIKAKGCTVVVRPDSGDPEEMSVRCIEALDQEFGHTLVKNGQFKLLNNVRVIYGDGITGPRVVRDILSNLKLRGYSADNIAFGMGGGLLQKCDRDSYEFAMKCSSAIVNGQTREVYKDPLGMSSKKSKKGYLDLIQHEDGTYETLEGVDITVPHPKSVLRTVFLNGKVLVDESLATIRARVLAQDEV